MMIGQHKITLHQRVLTDWIRFDQLFRKSRKAHDYTRYQPDLDYIIEPAERSNQCYMTGQGKRVRLGDRILLQRNQQLQAYIVKEIDYYANPSDMWIALLEKQYG